MRSISLDKSDAIIKHREFESQDIFSSFLVRYSLFLEATSFLKDPDDGCSVLLCHSDGKDGGGSRQGLKQSPSSRLSIAQCARYRRHSNLAVSQKDPNSYLQRDREPGIITNMKHFYEEIVWNPLKR